MLTLIALAMIASMGPWFAASASAGAIERELGLSVTEAAWLTMMVQLGFVAGTLTIAATGAADAFRAPSLMAAGGAARHRRESPAAAGTGLRARQPR